MDPLTLSLATIKSGFDFGIELLRYLQTPQGQAFAKRVMDDRAAWDKAWSDAGKWLEKFFKGDLFKETPHGPKP